MRTFRWTIVLAAALVSLGCFGSKESKSAKAPKESRPAAKAAAAKTAAAEKSPAAAPVAPAPPVDLPAGAAAEVPAGIPAEERAVEEKIAEKTALTEELERRQERIEKALQAVSFDFSETLPTRLGNLADCSPQERRRYNLAGEEIYVIVGSYPTEEAATTCIQAYEKFLGGFWNQYKSDFYRKGRFVLELNPKMEAALKEKAKKLVESALD